MWPSEPANPTLQSSSAADNLDGCLQDNDIWNRRLGLVGIWGGLIRQWLDELLPDDAHDLASGRVHVVIAKAPTLSLFEVRMSSTIERSPEGFPKA